MQTQQRNGCHFWKKRHLPVSSSSWERTRPTQAAPTDKPQAYLDEDGRRHRADAPYLLPKDEKELQRLDYQHFVLRSVIQGNLFAPVDAILKKGGHVLDVGSGTGRWGHEIAVAYPRIQVCGFDLEDVPPMVSTPLNYQFSRGNLLHGLPFAANSFQYTHQRLLVAAIPLDAWPCVVEEFKRVTSPQGWIELIEMGNTFHNAGPATKQFLIWWVAISATKGIDASKMSQLGTFLKQAMLSNIQMETKRVPIGSWAGRGGNLMAQNMLAGWPMMRPLAHSSLGVSPDVFDEVIARLETEWNSYQTT
jgi:SAM-dependent methyltransferase